MFWHTDCTHVWLPRSRPACLSVRQRVGLQVDENHTALYSIFGGAEGTELETSVWPFGSSRGLLGYILATCPGRLRQTGVCFILSIGVFPQGRFSHDLMELSNSLVFLSNTYNTPLDKGWPAAVFVCCLGRSPRTGFVHPCKGSSA